VQQILQSLRTGEIEVIEAPCPAVSTGHLLIRSHVSLISPGTERMLLQFGKAGLIGKTRRQPEKVWQAIGKIKTDGLWPTLNAVRNRLDQPVALGYCNVGTVLEIGENVADFQVGDRVVSNGKHAEVVCVPKNLCAKIPAGVADEAAVVTVVGAVGLQGIRLAQPTLGEAFVVTGLGLIGLLTVQLLRAHGCRVLGIDFNEHRLQLAQEFGAETFDLSCGQDPVSAAKVFSRGRGVDGVLITASTKSNEPLRQAAHMCRKRGRIVMVGVAGMQLSRSDFYEKELTFQVSCSYGPGRYDSDYEQRGRDYPLGFVRWTEQRNFEAVLDLLAENRLHVDRLISHRFPVDRASQAYALIDGERASLGVLLQYPKSAEQPDHRLRERTVRLQVDRTTAKRSNRAPVVGFIGAGNFAANVLIPAFKQNAAQLEVVASRNGQSSMLAARRFGFAEATTDVESVISNPNVDAVVIATRHDSHADLVCRALKSGKHVFVEKPLALNDEEATRIDDTYRAICRRGASPVMMIGFNRRFAVHTRKIASLLRDVPEPKSFIMTVNAGRIEPDHWIHDPKIGGGRIIGEGCHFIDLLRHLCGHPILSVQATKLGTDSCEGQLEDKLSFTLQFADGSLGTVHYLANGHRGFPKERLEVFGGGRVIQLDNFRKLRVFGDKHFRKINLWRQDKGHTAAVAAFLNAVQDARPSPIPVEEILEVTRASFAVIEAAKTNKTFRRFGEDSDRFRILEDEASPTIARSA
jgi:predicted dehydrogenase/threonine dehydrogenase-like Zn-dependent dehydrogenase